MKIFKIIFAALSIGLFSLASAHAGSGTFKHSNGSKVKVKCNSAGCFETFTDASGKKGKRAKVGPGGRSNFVKHKNKWASKGYK